MYTWYIEPRDARTNEVIGRELPTGNTRTSVTCEDGISRDLWECSYDFVARLLRDKKQLNLDFLAFNQEGAHGKIRKWVFTKRKKSAVKGSA